MKTTILIGGAMLVVGLGSWVIAQENMPAKPQQGEPVSEQKVTSQYSYAIGLNIGRNFKSEGTALDLETLLAGVRDGLSGEKPKYDDATCAQALQQLQQRQANAHVNKNKEFLAQNRQAEGVKVLPSGLQYKVLKQGDGPTPSLNDTVRAHYTGRFIDGSVFDSSVESGKPFVTPVTRVIKGWTEALTNMQVGSKWLIVVPSELAYGETGMGPIPPDSTLVFEMELLGIE